MNVNEDTFLSRRVIRATGDSKSAPITYPIHTEAYRIGKNNYPHNKMETRRVSHADAHNANANANTMGANTPDDADKKRSSKLEIFNDRVLGEGSFAKVFVARYKGKLVAVKIVDISNAKERHIRQFKRELDIIRILRKHPHPNIPEYYKIIESPTRIIIVMEWCRGGELGTLIKSGLDLTQVKYYFSQILSGYLHLLSLNIIHRDMKAQNIMLTHDLTKIKIIDFGLSKVINTDMTRTVVGSPAYMAPERLGAQDYDSTSDIWSLGIILYEMIYHVNPFHSCKNKATLIKSANTPIRLPTSRHCNVLTMTTDKESDSSSTDNSITRSRTIVRKTESVPSTMMDMMSGMLNIDPVERFDWDDLHRACEIVMALDRSEKEKLEIVLEFYRAVRKDAVDRSRASSNAVSTSSSSASRSNGSNSDSMDQNPMFDMEIDGIGGRYRDAGQRHKHDRGTGSDICLDGSEQSSIIRTQPEGSGAIPIPNSRARVSRVERSPQMAESLGNIAGASVEDRHLECLEDYFLTNDPAIFSLYEDAPNIDPPKRVKATDSGFIDVSFMDSIPFLQRDYREPRPQDLIKAGSEFGSMLYSKSAPVVTGVSRLAKKAGSTLTNIISPPS